MLEEGTNEKFDSLIARIAVLSGSNKDKTTKSSKKLEHKDSGLYHVVLKPDKNIFKRGINIKAIFDDLLDVGQSCVFQDGDKASFEQQVEKKECLSSWDFIIHTSQTMQNIESILMFLDKSEFDIKDLCPEKTCTKEEFLKISKRVIKEHSEENLRKIQEFSDTLSFEASVAAHQSTVKNTEKEMHSEVIKVSSNKLDHLMNLVSELVTSKAHLEILAQRIGDSELLKAVEQLDKLSKRFRDNALEIRVVPLGSILPKFKRLVHDLSQELGKKIDFIIEGADTELDKNIINSLENPLMHIIRNAADHGLESTEERIKSGKNPNGLLKFVAFYSGSNVFIQIQDDGVGINAEKVREKAINSGLITESEQLSTKDILNMIFLPGFSTASTITDISGRGVGMDVVKKTIEDLRGEIDITTEVGLGTSFTLKLPLTLSIIDTLHVKVQNISFLVPLSDVDLCDNVAEQIQKSTRNAFEIGGALVPFIDLRKEFGLEIDKTNHKVIIVKKEDKKTALIVDNIIGQHQAVIIPLGTIFKDQEFLSGGSIMGDGTVALVLDTNKLSIITK